MLTAKTRKQGNEVVIDVPESLDVEPGEEYVVIKGENGAFTYIPKSEDVFDKPAKEGFSLRPAGVWFDDDSVGGETF